MKKKTKEKKKCGRTKKNQIVTNLISFNCDKTNTLKL